MEEYFLRILSSFKLCLMQNEALIKMLGESDATVSMLFPNYLFQIFLQCIVFLVGRGVCLPAGWVQWHGLITIFMVTMQVGS